MDGAAWLRDLGHERVACLVAHHSESRFEIGLRGHAAALAAYERGEDPVRDALVYCDRRHRCTETLANLPTGVEVHVLPTGDAKSFTDLRQYTGGRADRPLGRRLVPAAAQPVDRADATTLREVAGGDAVVGGGAVGVDDGADVGDRVLNDPLLTDAVVIRQRPPGLDEENVLVTRNVPSVSWAPPSMR